MAPVFDLTRSRANSLSRSLFRSYPAPAESRDREQPIRASLLGSRAGHSCRSACTSRAFHEQKLALHAASKKQEPQSILSSPRPPKDQARACQPRASIKGPARNGMRKRRRRFPFSAKRFIYIYICMCTKRKRKM